MRHAVLLAALALATLPVSAAIEILQLRNRPASELIPILEPLAPEGVALSGDGFQLIARGDEAAIAELREAVRQLDRAAPALQVTVRRGESSERRSGGVEIATDDGDIGVGIGASERTERTSGTETVRVRAGDSAYIDAGGTQIVRRSEGHWRDRGAIRRDWRRGFLVTPRLTGDDRVRIDIEVEHGEALDRAGRAERRRLVTSATGRLGEWIELGGVSEATRRSRDGLTGVRRERAESDGRLSVHVERVE